MMSLLLEKKAFESCSSLIEIAVPSSVKMINESTFYGCSSLENVVIPSSVTSIGDYAFYNCKSLKKIEIYFYDFHLKMSLFEKNRFSLY